MQTASASGGTYEDLSGASAAANFASTNCIVDVYRPRKRFVKAVTKRTTSSKVGTLYAIRYLARDKAVQNVATGAGGGAVTFVQSPATG